MPFLFWKLNKLHKTLVIWSLVTNFQIGIFEAVAFRENNRVRRQQERFDYNRVSCWR
ncbi:hypothetical protein FQR65_LT07838 [Abscondita terminalis]|nr:hypothetical protein FQR65_LT07838 [Abscondita terminalis]